MVVFCFRNRTPSIDLYNVFVAKSWQILFGHIYCSTSLLCLGSYMHTRHLEHSRWMPQSDIAWQKHVLASTEACLSKLKHVCQNCMHVRCLFSDRFLLLKPPADWDASFCKFNIIRTRKLTNKSNLIREAATKHIYLFNWLKINEDPLKRKTKNAHYWDQVVVKRQKEKSNPYPICYNPQFVLGSRAAEAKGW